MKGYVRTQWSMAKVRDSLAVCGGDLTLWRERYAGAYHFVRRNGFLARFLREHHPFKEMHIVTSIRETTRPYLTFNEWRRDNPSLYSRACRAKLLDQVWQLGEISHRYMQKAPGLVMGEDGAFPPSWSDPADIDNTMGRRAI